MSSKSDWDLACERFRSGLRAFNERYELVEPPKPERVSIRGYVESAPTPVVTVPVDAEVAESARAWAAAFRQALGSWSDAAAKSEAALSRLGEHRVPGISNDHELSVAIELRNRLRAEIARVPRMAQGEIEERISGFDGLDMRIARAKEAGRFSSLEPTCLFDGISQWVKDRQAIRGFGVHLDVFCPRIEQLQINQTGRRILETLAASGVDLVREGLVEFACIPATTAGPVVDLLTVVEATRYAAQWLIERAEKRQAELESEARTMHEKRQAEQRRLRALLDLPESAALEQETLR